MKTDELLVNMGPQHPSTHGVLRLIIKTDGELVREATPVIGYLHRCAEKIGENIQYVQYVPYTDRMDYLSSMSDNLAYCLAVEKLLQIEIPPRGQALRVIMAELNRIGSHLLAFGTYGIDLGAFTPFLYAFREREIILNLFEIVSGARLTYNYVRIGGVMRDVSPLFMSTLQKFMDDFPAKVDEYNALLSENQIFVDRAADVGVLDRDLAINYGVTGPNLRASGVPMDVRRAEPYSGYEKYQFNIPVGRGLKGTIGDCWDRYYVRIDEMLESLKIVKQAVEGLPAGDILSKQLKKSIKPPPGEAYVRIENPRGELGFYVISEGKDKPTRVKVRAPSFCNLSVLPELSRDVLLADLVAILGSIDIVLGEVDR
ncbi:MAG: NADH-quinone oxidoreductase subunit D [Planctomycetes bacterium]|nr:NADH-quinone oxidoreductase subunit D [Planctomycetota bacterium]